MPSSSLAPSLWETVKCDFKSLFPEEVFQMWFEPMVCIEATGDAITLGVPNDFAAIWIHDNYLDLITQRLRLTAGRMVNVPVHKGDGAGRQGSAIVSGGSRPRMEPSHSGPKPRAAAPRRQT